MGKERRSEEELRQMMLAAARQHEECSDLEDLFIFGPTPRRDANWGFGIAGKENKVSVACFNRLDRIASDLQQKYELHPVKAGRRDIEARVWSLVHDHPTLAASLSREGGAYDIATFRPLNGRPNWTMEWTTDDQSAKAAFDRIVRSVQTQIELE
ncbi:hypothetical protein [Bradyrhizobium sp. OAE829]|uniref:hypothetical protein n=1 Tax=Bradyrhizobium sp. OAE829 TaxID=2663807 RepID=UPI00178ABBC7